MTNREIGCYGTDRSCGDILPEQEVTKPTLLGRKTITEPIEKRTAEAGSRIKVRKRTGAGSQYMTSRALSL